MNWREFLRPTWQKLIAFTILVLVIFVIPILVGFLTKNSLFLLTLFPFFALALKIKYAFSYTLPGDDVMYTLIPINLEMLALVFAGLVSYLVACIILLYIKVKKK